MNYSIIKDEKILRDFIDWLPVLNSDERYYLCLFARSKYTKDSNGTNGLPHIKSDKAQLKRFISDKERMFDKIKQLECQVGAYKQKDLIVPEEALALYITVNPRNIYRATMNTAIKLVQGIRDQNISMSPHQEALSEIQKAKSRTCYVDFDIDEKDEDILVEIKNYLDGSASYKILETRGGYHVLVSPDNIHTTIKNKWYNVLSKISDQTGDLMIPVPGCTQGMFIPKFI